jgi:hypothetical protein
MWFGAEQHTFSACSEARKGPVIRLFLSSTGWRKLLPGLKRDERGFTKLYGLDGEASSKLIREH